MSGIQRPFPGMAPPVQQPSANAPITQMTNVNQIGGIPTSTASYLTNYPNVNQTSTTTFIDDTTNLNRHFPTMDTNIGTIDLGVPTQFQTTNNSTNSFYPTQRIHSSPSATASFPPYFGYVQPSFNHHHHLSSNVDDASLLIQNPSLT